VVSLPNTVISRRLLHRINRTNRSTGIAWNCCILRYNTVLLSGWWLLTSRTQILPPNPRFKQAQSGKWQILQKRQYPLTQKPIIWIFTAVQASKFTNTGHKEIDALRSLHRAPQHCWRHCYFSSVYSVYMDVNYYLQPFEKEAGMRSHRSPSVVLKLGRGQA
jgi:hypothetical protein